MLNPTHISGADSDLNWRYEVAPNTDSKVNLLTIGRIAASGNWYGDYGEFFIAWAPLPKRNKELESRLVHEGVIPR